jgi:serine protease Do
VRRPYIGVSVVDLDDGAAKKLKSKPGEGVVVSDVAAKSPGERANIGVNDVITRVNGAAVRSARELQRAILALPAGHEAELIVVRNGKVFRTKVAVEEQAEEIKPAEARVPATLDYGSLGLSVTELAADSAKRAGLPREIKGVIVAKVTPNSPAARSGLAPGQVILQVNKVLVASAEEFRRAVEQSGAEKGAVLHVLKQNGDVDFVILRAR